MTNEEKNNEKDISVLKMEPKTGFTIGWDWYAYRLKLPENSGEYAAFLDGYNAARDARVTALEHDRFVRKLMLLRMNAWKRGRIFSDDVSSSFLRSIDNGKCPVSQVDLTHGTITENDWSVDRINNNGGYVRGNLMILSTRVNKAKGNKSFNQMWDIAYGGHELNEVIDGLSVYEWRRLTLISSCVVSEDENGGEMLIFGYALAPAICSVPVNITVNPSIIMQTELAKAAAGQLSKGYERILSGLPKPLRREFNLLKRDCHKEIVKSRAQYPNDVWNNIRLFKQFFGIFSEISLKDRQAILVPYIAKQSEKDLPGNPDAKEWGLHTKGYVINR